VDGKTKSVNNRAIGQRMREERERLGFTREQLAETVDLAPLYIGQLERGERQMSLDTLVKICDRLHISADHLLYGETPGLEAEKGRIIGLLNKCSNNELLLIENIIKSVVSYTERELQKVKKQ